MPRSVECQSGYRAEGGIRRLQGYGSGSGLIGQQTRVPGEPSANPIPEGLDLARRQLLAGRHVRFGPEKDRRQQSTLIGPPLENHRPLLAALEHLLPSQQRKPSFLLGLAVARKAFVAQQRQSTPRQRIARACGTRGRGQQQHRGPKGPEPEPELSWDAVDHGREESQELKPLFRQRQPSYHQKTGVDPACSPSLRSSSGLTGHDLALPRRHRHRGR
jgi:hypothetical protein